LMRKSLSAKINNTTEVGELMKELKIPGNAVKVVLLSGVQTNGSEVHNRKETPSPRCAPFNES
jgi:hypothetical protein